VVRRGGPSAIGASRCAVASRGAMDQERKVTLLCIKGDGSIQNSRTVTVGNNAIDGIMCDTHLHGMVLKLQSWYA
jgi:hypothetical protein